MTKKVKEKSRVKSTLEEHLTEVPVNRMNVMASSIIGNLVDLRNQRVKESFTNLDSMEHRQELVCNLNGVNYVNDAYATKVNATWFALDEIATPIIWIAGGVEKNNDYGQILDLVKAKVKAIILLGKDSQRLMAAFHNVVPFMEIAHNMEDAVMKATIQAAIGDTVLLSPACPSFDVYKSYADKGIDFCNCVEKIAAMAPVE